MHTEFLAGSFTVIITRQSHTSHPLSVVVNVIDQAHEQNNAAVEGEGGVVNSTENSTALRCWMACRPEMDRLISKFKSSMETNQKKENIKHSEQTKHTQKVFCDSSSDLLKLNSR